MSDQLSTLSADDIAEFKTREAKAISSLKQSADSYQEFTAEFVAICKRELWRAKHKTKEDFIASLREAVGISRSQFFKKIQAEEIRFQTLKSIKSHRETKNAESLEKSLKSMSERQLLAMGKAPAEKRVEVLQKAVPEFGKSPSTSQIESTVKALGNAAAAKAGKRVEDEGGTEIPQACWPYWDQREEFQKHMTAISHAKCWVDEQIKSGNKLLHMVTNSVIADLSRAYQILEQAKPAHVCTVCQGRPELKPKAFCDFCGGSGLLAHWRWKTQGNPKLREIQEKAAAARKLSLR